MIVGGDKHNAGQKKGLQRLPQLLKDMRDVYNDRPVRGQGRNECPGVKALRSLLAKDPEKFAARLWKMEQDQKAMQMKGRTAAVEREAILDKIGPTETVGAEEEDVGEARAVELLERLLAEEGWKK